jgi:hypothetical protein
MRFALCSLRASLLKTMPCTLYPRMSLSAASSGLRLRFIGALVLAAVCVCAAAAFAAQSNHGILEIRIKDHRDAIDDFAKVAITIESVAISPKTGLRVWQRGWRELKVDPATLDLTRYVDGKTIIVFRGAVDAGRFNAFHLKIKSIDGMLKKIKKSAPIKNSVAPVKLEFNVPAKGETILIIDLTVMDLSDHPPRGYELEIKGYELFTNGKLIRKVPPG